MKKTFFILIFMLIFLTSSLIFLQWNGYTSASDGPETKDKKQLIKVIHQKEGLIVEQIISNLEEETVPVSFPAEATDMSCTNGSEKECKWIGPEKKQIVLEGNELTFRYTLPALNSEKSVLLTNWSVQLQDQPIALTRVQLSDRKSHSGSWIADARLLGLKEMSLLDYYVFENSGDAPVLYWQKEKLLKKAEFDNVTIYSNQDFILDKDIISAFRSVKGLKSEQQIQIILTNLHEEMKIDSLMIIQSQKKLSLIQEEIVKKQLALLFQFPEQEKWIVDIIASGLLQKPIGEKKAQTMYSELKTELGKESFAAWLDKIFDGKEVDINAEKLDGFIEAPLGMEAKFFSINAQIEDSMIPLYFVDARDIHINEQKSLKAHIIIQDGKRYISLVPLLTELEYQVKYDNKEEVHTEKGPVKYRFYVNKRIFRLDEQKYGMKESPVVELNHDIYIEFGLINTFFNVTITEEDTQINIF
ncbi:stalk domain-containing protein [Bacillus sp. FSL K6-3431]|uniref:stalk domain-containing protein n=1 Tax=Bacillus sp. FSL K6-3431 TaxID=2921500 RepID=UPI0030FBD10B